QNRVRLQRPTSADLPKDSSRKPSFRKKKQAFLEEIANQDNAWTCPSCHGRSPQHEVPLAEVLHNSFLGNPGEQPQFHRRDPSEQMGALALEGSPLVLFRVLRGSRFILVLG